MLEAEMGFTSENDLCSITSLLEGMLRHVVLQLQTSSTGRDLLRARDIDPDSPHQDGLLSARELESRWDLMSKSGRDSWLHISYEEAIKELQEAAAKGHPFNFKPELGAALQAEHEKFLATRIGQGSPVFVTDYPRDIKAFYMSPGKPIHCGQETLDTVSCFDLIVPDLCEIAGGSVREHRLPELLHSMKQHGMIPEADESRIPTNLRWYTDLRRYGSVPHGGFGLGFDRLLGYLSGIPSVRDVVTFPRWYGRCDC